jgi:flagellar assembly protein FliH
VLAADSVFVPLIDVLRSSADDAARDAAGSGGHDPAGNDAHCALAETEAAFSAGTPSNVAPSVPCGCAHEVARDVRIFRAQLADALDAASDRLMRELAYAVLGRELQLAPPDLAAIVARILVEHPDAQALRVRVAPSDAHALDAAVPAIVADASLAPGDAIIELSCGSIDARLGVRLAAILDAAS